jgi:hypothetical protein
MMYMYFSIILVIFITYVHFFVILMYSPVGKLLPNVRPLDDAHLVIASEQLGQRSSVKLDENGFGRCSSCHFRPRPARPVTALHTQPSVKFQRGGWSRRRTGQFQCSILSAGLK